MAADPFQDDPFFAELQAVWDEHSRSIEAIASRPEAQPSALNLKGFRSPRRRLAALHLLLVLTNITVAIWSLVAFLPEDYNLIRITVHVLATTCGIMAILSIVNLHRLRQDRREPHSFGITISNAAEELTSVRQIATISMAAIAILVSVSCVPVGDGHAMTATGYANRATVIMNVNKTISQL